MKTAGQPSGADGQTVLELCLSFTLIIPLVFGASVLLREQWIQTACARAVFETTRAHLEGRFVENSRFVVIVVENADSITGSASCVRSRQTVRLPRLEALRKANL